MSLVNVKVQKKLLEKVESELDRWHATKYTSLSGGDKWARDKETTMNKATKQLALTSVAVACGLLGSVCYLCGEPISGTALVGLSGLLTSWMVCV
jgi:hypothetical protein